MRSVLGSVAALERPPERSGKLVPRPHDVGRQAGVAAFLAPLRGDARFQAVIERSRAAESAFEV